MITGLLFRDSIISAANNISNSRQAVDALNVFPVPDGDTGTNMSMTITAAALLRGARGNSGVILSLIFRGFSKGFRGLTSAGAKDLANAFKDGVDAAYKAVMKPTEGTILTVIRKASEAAQKAAETQDDPFEVGLAALTAAKEALAKTPELLPVLKKAGVVDAGGQGLVLIFEGIESVWRNGVIVQPLDGSGVNPVSMPSKATVAAASDDIEFGYCSEFLIEKSSDAKEKDPLKLRAYLESIGDCVVVVDDSSIIKVHVHSNCPGNVIQAGLKYGQLINIKIDNMRYQHANADVGVKEGEKVVEPEITKPENEYGFVAVCAGEGLEELFSDIGADTIVSGGQTMNPSTDDILNAIMKTPAKVVFVLPNNKNIIMAAQQCAALTEKQVVVIPTKTVPQGITAMMSFDPDENDPQTIAQAMVAAAQTVSTAQITYAARNSDFDGFAISAGDYLALTDGKLFGTDQKLETLLDQLAALAADKGAEFITVFYGDGVTQEDAQRAEQRFADACPEAEVSLLPGGQPVYYYIISIE